MRVVRVADLKNRLSQYLREVREGGEILIKDRNVPIAKIVPLGLADDMEVEMRALIAAGKLRPPTQKATRAFWNAFWATPAPDVPPERMVSALVANREER